MIFSVVKQVMKCMCHCVPIFAGFFFFFFLFSFLQWPHKLVCSHIEKKSREESERREEKTEWSSVS